MNGNGSKKPEKRLTPRPQVKLTRLNSTLSPTHSSNTSISANSSKKLKNKIKNQERYASTRNKPLKDSKLLTPTETDPSPTMRSKLDLRNLPNPKTTSSPLMNGNGSRQPEQKLTPRPQVKLTRKNSTDSPTPSSDTSTSAISPEKKELKENNDYLFNKTSKFFQRVAEGT
jgi:hypothetical protein